jgi:CBS domain-containing protein
LFKRKPEAAEPTANPIPEELKVADAMTAAVHSVAPNTPAEDVVRKMLGLSLKDMIVMTDSGEICGIITQSNLSQKLKMLLRLGILAELEPRKAEAYLDRIPLYTAAEIMTHPVITIENTQPLIEAARKMIKHGLKRLPVVDAHRKLVGIISRIDIFRAMTGWEEQLREIENQAAPAGVVVPVRAIMDRTVKTVTPETPIPELLNILYTNNLQRVAVTEKSGRLVGIVSDHELLPFLSDPARSGAEIIINKQDFITRNRRFQSFVEHAAARSAAEIMNRHVISVWQESPVTEAIRLMTGHGLKRLPVVDEAGCLVGVVGRDSLLRAVVEPGVSS